VISSKRGRPLLLPEELDNKLRTFLIGQRKAGGTINRHTVYGVLMGLIKSNFQKYGGLLDFAVTDGWLNYLYRRMNFVRRTVTTTRPIVTEALWIEMQTLFLNDICTLVKKYNIPDELIINVDQTPSKYVPTSSVTMAEKNSKHVAKQGADDKRAITMTLAETLSGDILPFQLIYTGKTTRSLPAVEFPEGFLLGFNKSHWSNEEETLRLLKQVISPYISKMKRKLKLPEDQVACLIWDAFKAQSTEAVKLELENLNIKDVQVPKNMTHLLQPLDLTTNGVVKKMEQREFSNYFTTCITEAMLADPNRDVASIKVDLKLSTLKPLHAKTVSRVYMYLQGEEGRKAILNGFNAAGITKAVESTRANAFVDSLNPYI
jgi:hypothetical protein